MGDKVVKIKGAKEAAIFISELEKQGINYSVETTTTGYVTNYLITIRGF